MKQLLKGNIPELQEENSIVFDSPADMEASTAPRLAIFLYQIVENATMRNAARNAAPEAGRTKIQRPPLILDLHYLFTPYSQNRETEFIILERLMQVLYDNPVLRGALLQGNLKESGNDEIRVTPTGLSLDELNKLWAVFPNKPYKLSASYLLTPVKIPSAISQDITRVRERSIGIHLMEGKNGVS